MKDQRRSPFAAMSSTAYTGGLTTGNAIGASFKPFTGSSSVGEVPNEFKVETSLLLQQQLGPIVGTVRHGIPDPMPISTKIASPDPL